MSLSKYQNLRNKTLPTVCTHKGILALQVLGVLFCGYDWQIFDEKYYMAQG